MINKSQLELAKILWEQARASYFHAQKSLDFVKLSQKKLRDSHVGAGYKFSESQKKFDKSFKNNNEIAKLAFEYMGKMSLAYGELYKEFKNAKE